MFFGCLITILIFLCQLVCYSFTTNKSETSAAILVPKDPTTFLKFEGKTYYFQTVFKASYFKATQFCNKHGMRLVSITSQTENTRLGRFAEEIGSSHDHFWTSGINILADGGNEWIWLSTGANMVYTRWYPGEPNKIKNSPEYCVEARSVDDRGFSWNNAPCHYEFSFICESLSSEQCITL